MNTTSTKGAGLVAAHVPVHAAAHAIAMEV